MKESCTFSFVSSLLTGSWAFSSQLQAHYPPPIKTSQLRLLQLHPSSPAFYGGAWVFFKFLLILP